MRGGTGRLEGEEESGPIADCALGPGAAVVPVHDLADAGQADAGAGELLRGVQALEWLEQLVRECGVEARTVVPHVAADAGVRGGGHPELDRSVVAATGELPGVVQQVVQYFADKVGVGHGTGGLLDREADAAARVLALEFGGDGGCLGTEIDRLEIDRCPGDARQVQQVVENVSHVLAGGLDPLSVGAAILTEGIGVILHQGGAEPGQRAQRRPQIVGEGVGEGLQVLVDAPEIVAYLPLLGDVADGGGYEDALAGVEGG